MVRCWCAKEETGDEAHKVHYNDDVVYPGSHCAVEYPMDYDLDPYWLQVVRWMPYNHSPLAHQTFCSHDGFRVFASDPFEIDRAHPVMHPKHF